jgi:hypothetical protein
LLSGAQRKHPIVVAHLDRPQDAVIHGFIVAALPAPYQGSCCAVGARLDGASHGRIGRSTEKEER